MTGLYWPIIRSFVDPSPAPFGLIRTYFGSFADPPGIFPGSSLDLTWNYLNWVHIGTLLVPSRILWIRDDPFWIHLGFFDGAPSAHRGTNWLLPGSLWDFCWLEPGPSWNHRGSFENSPVGSCLGPLSDDGLGFCGHPSPMLAQDFSDIEGISA